MANEINARLDRVQNQLRLYEHPLFAFSARPKGDGVEIQIEPKTAVAASLASAEPSVHTYVFEFHPRDIDQPQFEWQFQRQLYDSLHDYLIELFVRTPQDRADRRERGL